MFALALWDERRDRLLLAPDRMGQKPFYWHFSAEVLVWGSEAKAVLAAPWVERRVNPIALHHYLTLPYTPDPLTIYESIYQLPAAHKLVIEPGGEPEFLRWWQLEFESKWKFTESEAVKRLVDEEVDVILELVGTRDEEANYKSLVRDLRIANRVEFSGYVAREQ
jgi:asparagine synthase (glutamine-hydrolysing)